MGKRLADVDRQVTETSSVAAAFRERLRAAPSPHLRNPARTPAEAPLARMPLTNLPEGESPRKTARAGKTRRERWPAVSVRVPPALYALLRAYMIRTGRGISEIVREGLARVLPIPQGLS
jgi:hypothetical protein